MFWKKENPPQVISEPQVISDRAQTIIDLLKCGKVTWAELNRDITTDIADIRIFIPTKNTGRVGLLSNKGSGYVEIPLNNHEINEISRLASNIRKYGRPDDDALIDDVINSIKKLDIKV